MDLQDKQLSEAHLNRLKKCLLAVKISVGLMLTALAAVVIFAIVAGALNLKESNPNAVLLGAIILLSAVLLSFLCGAISFIAARLTMAKIQKSVKKSDDN